MKKILYIEDENDHHIAMRMLLESRGHQLISAMDGLSGLQNVSEQKPDLILLDMTVPKLHGLELLKKVKADPETKSIPVIVLTACATEAREQECKNCGADFFIKKPFDSMDLLKKIEHLLK